MDKKTPNKRKSLAGAKETPNKILKLTHTPVSEKINKKSPRAASKIIQKQIHENKSPKSPKYQKKQFTHTPVPEKVNTKSPRSASEIIQKQINGNNSPKSPKNLKKQTNGKLLTHKGKKISKQIEEDDTDDESDNSEDELNVNNDAFNSDNEVQEEDDSNEESEVEDDSEVEEADSDEEEAALIEEQVDSDENEANSDVEEADSDVEESDSDGEEADTDEEEADTDEEEADSGEVENNKKAARNGLEAERCDELCVFVKGIKPDLQLSDVFKDCNIATKYMHRDPQTRALNGKATVTFRDKESVQKALAKNDTEYGDYILTVEPIHSSPRERTEFGVYVSNFSSTKPEDVFKDSKIKTYNILRDFKNRPTGKLFVQFKNEKSVQNALLKHGTEYKGRKLSVTRDGCSVFVNNLKADTKLEDVFKNIHWFHKINDHCAKIYFKDNKSCENALLIHGTEYNGRKIYVAREGCSVFVENIKADTNLEDLFKDCNIHWIHKLQSHFAKICFKDKESREKALAKNKTEYDGSIIKVEICGKQKYKKFKNQVNLKCNNPASNIEYLKRKLLAELKSEAQKLEKEIYGKSKPIKKKPFQKYNKK